MPVVALADGLIWRYLVAAMSKGHVKVTNAQAQRIAEYLERVVPRSPAEQAELLAIHRALVPR